jgi:tetratricopeptide (TPR) repeat protein
MQSNRQLFFCFLLLICTSVLANEDIPEFIKSLPVEKAACRERLKSARFDEAAEPCRAWVTLAKGLVDRADALAALGQAYAGAGDIEEASAAFDEAAGYLIKSPDASHLDKWVQSQALRARLAEGRDQMEQARFIYVQTEEQVRSRAGTKSVAYALAAENRAAFLARVGELPKATELFTAAVGAYDSLYGAYNEKSLETLLNLAVAQLDADLKAQGERSLLSLINAMRLGKRAETEGAAEAMTFLGNLRAEQQDFSGALSYFRQALNVRQKLHGQSDLRTAQSLSSAGIMHVKLGQLDKAEAALSSAYVIRRNLLGEEDGKTLETLNAVRAVVDMQKAGESIASRRKSAP